MLTRFAHVATRRSRAVLVAAVVFFVAAGAIGGGVAENLTTAGFEDPATESVRAEDALEERFGAGTPNVILLVTAPDGADVDSPEVAAAGQALTDELAAEDGVTNVVSYWSEGNAPPLRSEDGSRALVAARIPGEDDAISDRIETLAPAFERTDDGPAGIDVQVGGSAAVFLEVGETIEEDLLTAEMIAFPITLVLLVLVFGSLVAATLPLVIGVLSIIGTFFVLQLLTGLTDVSVYALNLTTAMGLGLAIDYSLFVVYRYREELRATPDAPHAAVVRTVRTAGRTVAFSALTVAAALCALLVFPLSFLRSFAYAGVAVAVLAGLFSLVVLPALLALLGHRVNALTLWRRSVTPPEEGFWHRMALFVMRRPIPVATAAVALLLVLGAPFLGLRLSLPDDRVLQPGSDGRVVGDVLRDEFSSTEIGTLSVVTAEDGADIPDGELDRYAATLAAIPGVSRVDAATGTYCGEGLAGQLGCEPGRLVLGPDAAPRYAGFRGDGGTYLSVVPEVEPMSDEGEDLLHAVRDTAAPTPMLVGGLSANLVDINDSLFDRLPMALGLIAVITAVLLFLMFGSVVIPLKAIVLNLLSLTATFGAMVWIFQDGNLSGLLDFTATGGLNAVMPILMFCIAFGLSMDYEVFLLSRIKEEHDKGADNVQAVAVGLERTGRLVTAAAVLISVVFAAFAFGRVSFIQMFGVGLTLAVLMDAFVIRGTLVPAFMRLAGEWNWWAPGPLRRFHDRWGISETVDLTDRDDRVDVAVAGQAVGHADEPGAAHAADAAGAAEGQDPAPIGVSVAAGLGGNRRHDPDHPEGRGDTLRGR
jgi:RND superfamily putative drug exporter